MKLVSTKKLHINILILGSIFILLSIFHNNLWFDETYSVAMANQSFSDIWKIGGNDVHPVLYYWMLRIVCLLTGGSILAYRVFSAIPIILLGIVGFTHIRKDFGEKTGLLFTFFSLFMPSSIIYANQIRMYSWAALILTLFFIYAYRIYKGKNTLRNWICFGLFSLSSIYIHYYGLMAAGITNVILCISLIKNKRKKDLRNIIILGLIQFLIYMPWLVYFAKQLKHVSKGMWIPLDLENALKIIGNQFIGNLKLHVVVTISILIYMYIFVATYIKRKQIDIKPVVFSILIYIMVIIAAIIVQEILNTSILYYRYLFVIIGLFIFSISYILANENNRYIVVIICTTILILSIANNMYQIKENYNIENKAVINYLNENVKKEDVFIYDNTNHTGILLITFKNNVQYFYNPSNWGVEKAYKAYGDNLKVCLTEEFVTDIENRRIWIIDKEDESVYNNLFNNDNYEVLSNRKITTNYYEKYIYNIRLVKRSGE